MITMERHSLVDHRVVAARAGVSARVGGKDSVINAAPLSIFGRVHATRNGTPPARARIR